MELESMSSEDPLRNTLRRFNTSVSIVSSITPYPSSARPCCIFVAVDAEFPSVSHIMYS